MRVAYLGVPKPVPAVLRAAGIDVDVLRAPRELVGGRHDWLVVAGWGRRIPSDLLAIPRLGTLNIHPSLLPEHRGPEPLRWALLHGDERFGVSIHRMTAVLDRGPIVFRGSREASLLDTHPPLLHELLTRAALELPRLLRDAPAGVDVEGDGSYESRVPPALLRLDPSLDAETFRRRVAAACDLGCGLSWRGAFVRVERAAVVDGPRSGSVGEVLSSDHDLACVQTSRGCVLVVTPGRSLPRGAIVTAPALRRGRA